MKAFFEKYQHLLPGLLLLLILGVGAYLRLYRISDYMTFLGDEGRDVLVVKRMIVDRKFTLLGPTASVGGFFLGPIYYYFMLPFLWWWKLDPAGPAVMVALFGVATVYLVYKAGKEFFDDWVGLSAASLYALSPLVIAYSRSSWNPNLVPFFSLALVYLLWLTVAQQRWKLLFWIGVVLGIGLQLHYLFTFLGVLTFAWFLMFGRKKELARFYLLGITGFMVGYGPFLAFELRHGFPNTQTIIRFLTEGKDVGLTFQQFLKNITDVPFRLYGRLVFRLPQPEIWPQLPAWQMFAWINGTKLAVYTTVGLLILLVTRRLPLVWAQLKAASLIPPRWQAVALLLLWFLVIVLLFGFYRRAIYDYYFGIIFALPFLALGVLLSTLQLWRYGGLVSVTILIALLYLNWQGRPFLHPPNRQLAQARNIAAAALEKTQGKPFNFALITAGNSDHAFRYFFEIWGHPPVTIEPPHIDPDRITVTDQLIVICEDLSMCKPLGHPLWEIAGFGQAEIDGEWNVSFVKILRLVHYKGEKSP